MTDELANLRAVWDELYPERRDRTMPLTDIEHAMIVLFERQFDMFRQEMDRRSWVKKFPPAYAEGAEPQRNVGWSEIE